MPGAAADVVWLRRGQFLLAVLIPVLLVLLIGTADLVEGPDAAFVGALTFIPMLSAVFGSVRQTAAVGAVVFLAGWGVGQLSADGRTATQAVRLVIIATVVLVAVAAAGIRAQRDKAYRAAVADLARHKELATLAITDDLTGLLNRRGAARRLEPGSAVGTHRPPATGLRCVAIADCDDLKAVNDEYGHVIGDEFLQAVAGRLLGAVSAEDMVARWGGDEFLLVVDLPLELGEQVLKRAREAVSHDPVRTRAGELPASVSMGVTDWLPAESMDAAVQRAETALNHAQAGGRANTLVVAAEPETAAFPD